MTVHFVCRGNAFRSVIAEAYLKSLNIKGVKVLSSGTVADESKIANKANFQKTRELLRKHGIERFAKNHYADQLREGQIIAGDVIICVNQRAYDECVRIGKLSDRVVIWDVTDIGEPGRMPTTDAERWTYMEDVYQEIVRNVDELVKQLGLARTGG